MLITLTTIKNLKTGDKVIYINNEPLRVEWTKEESAYIWIKFHNCHPILETPSKKVFKVIDHNHIKRGDKRERLHTTREETVLYKALS